jgi:hypothetical protein
LEEALEATFEVVFFVEAGFLADIVFGGEGIGGERVVGLVNSWK